MPVEVLLPSLLAAIAALFGLWSTYLVNDRKSLKKQVGELEAENKSYLPLLVLIAAGNEESAAKLRRQAAALLEKQSGVDLGE